MFKKIITFLFLFLISINYSFWNDNFLSDFKINFQNPSYVEETWIKWEYLCDENKDECKMNFNLTDENWEKLSTKYSCEILTDFNIWDNANKCNPSTIIVPKESKKEIKFRIFNEDKSKKLEKKVLIENKSKDDWNNSEEKEFISDFEIDFQNPSYVEETANKWEYLCDENKEDCKINFQLLNNWKDISKKYNCEIITDFNIWDNTNKCNPTTITLPKNSTQKIKFKIFNVDKTKFLEKEIIVKNPLKPWEKVDFLDFFEINLQRPSYIEEIDNSWEYLCDEKKDECKINFQFLDKSGQDIDDNYNCEIVTDFDIWTNTNRCNPTTIIIPSNTDKKIKLIIYNKNDWSKFVEKEILIKNIFENNTDENNDWDSEDNNSEDKNNEEVFGFKYILQSPSYVLKIWENNLQCDWEKSSCKINFKLVKENWKDISSRYSCEIITDFNIWEEANKCNPNTITIPKNTDQNIIFKIYDENKQLLKEFEVFIDNTIEHYLPYIDIQVQWAASKYKKIWYKNITCYTYDKCSINFTSWINKADIRYKWDFRNGERYYWYNPKTVKFSPWFYRVKLILTDDFWWRKVFLYKVTVKQLLNKSEQNVIKKSIKDILFYKENIYSELDNKLEINKFLKKQKKQITKKIKFNKIKNKLTVKNIFWKWIKLKKTLVKKSKKNNNKKIAKSEKNKKQKISYKISFQKKNLKISWKTLANSIINIKIWEQFFTTNSNNKWKYSIKINNNLTAWKYKILISVLDENWKIIAKKETREKEITQKYISQLNKYKQIAKIKSYKKYKKKYKIKTKKFKIENKTYSSIIPIIKQEKDNFNIKIFLINTLISILWMILFYTVLIRKKVI